MRTDLPARLAPGGGELDNAATDYLQLQNYFRIIYRRRWIIVAVVALGLSYGAVSNWLTVPVYQAAATVQIDMDPNVLGDDNPLIPLDQRDWMREFLPTQLGIVQSRDVARLALVELSRPPKELKDTTVPASALPDTEFEQVATVRVPSLDEISAGRTVSLVRDTRLVNIGFRSTDPVLSARVANALAKAYLQQNLDFRVKATREATDWLAKQVEEQRRLVQESEGALLRYRKEHGADALVTDKAGVEPQNIVVQKLAQLQGAETEAKIDTIRADSEYKQLRTAQANAEPLDSVPAIAANGYIQALKTELAGLQRELAQSSKELGARHPDIVKLKGAISATERKLQTELSIAARAIENQYAAARARERDLTAALRQQQAEVQALNGKAIQYTTLEREANTNRQLLDTLLQRSSETALAGKLQTTNVRVVDWARVPGEPILPRKRRTLTMALFASGALALLIVFTAEIFDRRIKSPQDVTRHLRIPVVGVLPQVSAAGKQGPVLLDHGAPALFAELFHVIRANLLLTRELSAAPTLLVTSPAPSEGKTMAAANLAVSLARLNWRVILLDADLRNPQLHEIFGDDRGPGLADVLAGRATGREIRRTNVPGLSLMPAGHASENPSDLLGSTRFSDLIVELRKQFEWIVLDSPPVLAVADPCLIARAASGVLLVVDSRNTTKSVAAAAVERLDAVGATLVGAVLNRVVLGRDGDSYLPYYHRDYKAYYLPQDAVSRPKLPPRRSAAGGDESDLEQPLTVQGTESNPDADAPAKARPDV